MDISRYKKIAIPKIEAGEAIKKVRDIQKKDRYLKQDKFEEYSTKALPITKELGELRQQQEQRQLQLAALPEQINAAVESPLALPPPTNQAIVDVDNNFTPEDFKILNHHNLPKPSSALQSAINNPDYIVELIAKAGKLNKTLGMNKGHLSYPKVKKTKHQYEISQLDTQIKTIKKYNTRLNLISKGLDTVHVGKGVYTQPKRNAYKIDLKNGSYGNLIIDVPKLFGQLRLVAHQNNKKVYDKRIDFDTLDLFTKRFNSNKKYSPLSKMIFDDLNRISEIPIHRTSKKYKKIGSGVVYYNNPYDLLSRLELLGGSIQAGNKSVSDEFIQIAHTLNKLGVINNNKLNKIFKQYII